MNKTIDLATSLERHLGDPQKSSNPVSFAAALDHEDREAYPHGMLSVLHEWGLQDHQLPIESGGRGTSIQESLELVRVVARRDAGLATSFSLTNLGFMPLWVAGTEAQKNHYATAVRNGAVLSWGLSERDHGSDIMATEMRAEHVEGGYLVNGEKWPIGNSAICDSVALFTRTGDRSRPTAYSVLMLDRRAVPAGCVKTLPRERLHGLRGADNGGLRLTDCFVPHSALVGKEGQGLEIALKASLAVRPLVNSMALGTTDTALRLALDFATQRMIFNQRVVDAPHSRRRLVECFADLMIADALASSATRALHVVPDQSSVLSSVAKFFVPTLLERTNSQLATVLGARHYLRSDPHYGVFHKATRDLWISHFGEGNTAVNLKNLATQMSSLTEAAVRPSAEARSVAQERANTVYDFDAELPLFKPWTVELRSRHGDIALADLPATLDRLRSMSAKTSGPEERYLCSAAEFGQRFLDEIHRIRRRQGELHASMGRDHTHSAEMFDLAEQYCVIHAAACVLNVSARSMVASRDVLSDSAVLLLSLARLWQRFHPLEQVAGPEVVDVVADVVIRLHTEGRAFSRLQYPLAEARV